MKAIFEFEMPDCCANCTLMYKTTLIEVCAAVKMFPGDALRRRERACFCPLTYAKEYIKEQFAETASPDNLERIAISQGLGYDRNQSVEENRTRIMAAMKESEDAK